METSTQNQASSEGNTDDQQKKAEDPNSKSPEQTTQKSATLKPGILQYRETDDSFEISTNRTGVMPPEKD